MQKILDNLLSLLAAKLAPLSPFAKAVVPAGLSVATAGVDAVVALVSGSSVSTAPLIAAGAGLVAALVAYLLPNGAKAAKAAPVPPAK